jgi:hypothetical protein
MIATTTTTTTTTVTRKQQATYTGAESVMLVLSVVLRSRTFRNISITSLSAGYFRILSLEPDTTSAARPVEGVLKIT